MEQAVATCQGAVGHADPWGTGKRATCFSQLGWASFPSPHLPTSPCSTARDNCSSLDPSLDQLGSAPTSKPLCSSKLSYLPHIYPSQRLSTLLCLWSGTFLFLLCFCPRPLEPRLFAISLPLILLLPLGKLPLGRGNNPCPAEAPAQAPLWKQKMDRQQPSP